MYGFTLLLDVVTYTYLSSNIIDAQHGDSHEDSGSSRYGTYQTTSFGESVVLSTVHLCKGRGKFFIGSRQLRKEVSN